MSEMDRRQFLKVMLGAGGTLIVGIPLRAAHAATPPVPLALLGDNWTRLSAFVSIEPNGRTLIGARAPDTGQGVRTALPRIIADELDADWTRVEVLALPLGVEDDNGKPRWLYGPQHAGGSRNI
ncbi:isoquinoline 1-oxidoreductase beta subunit, partial [mine drainage metagenome]